MRILPLLIALLVLCSCNKPDPTYNPFDNVFDVDLDKIIEDQCDILGAGCGYMNFFYKKGDHLVYYQVYKDEEVILAKGLSIPLDTFWLSENSSEVDKDSLEFAMYTNPVDTGKVDSLLSIYRLTRQYRQALQPHNSWIFKGESNMEFKLELQYFWCGDLAVAREFNFYRRKDKTVEKVI